MTKTIRQAFRGNVFNSENQQIGALFAVDGGYQVRGHDDMGRVASPLFSGRVFAGSDFAFIEKIDFGYAVERRYRLAA
jgi:hypothetical protein